MSKFLSLRKKRIFPVILASLALPLIICLEAPFEIYGSNLSEFLFSLSDFLPFCLLIGFSIALVAAALLFLLPEKVYRFAYPIVVAIAFLFFVQGTYLNLGLNSLPGDNMGESGISTAAAVINTIVWLLVIGLAVASAFLGKRDIIGIVCVLLSVIVLGTQIVNTVFVALSNDQIAVPKYDRMKQSSTEYVPKVMTRQNLTALSDSRNVVVFLIDRFDEDYAERAYKETPEVYDELTGFTWFQDHVALYGHTYPAVTWMLTNTSYSCETGREDYLNSAYSGETPLKRLSDAGYSVNVYTQSYYAYSDEFYIPEYVANVVPKLKPSPISTGNRFSIAGNMIQMALYRCLPFVMKGLIGNISSSANAKIAMESQAEYAYSLDLKDIYENLTESDFTVNEGKSYSFIHLTGCHDVSYNENWEEPTKQEARNFAVSVRVSFKSIDRYIREMKRLGVYDDATIIITGDHASPISDTREVRESRMTALFVKPAGSGSDPLKISSAQVSHDDLWATIFKSEGFDFAADYGTSVFDVAEGTNRSRRLIWQTYVRDSLDEYVYEISGPARDFANWREVSHEHYDKFLMD